MKSWLILDVSNLGWRAFHALPDLSFQSVRTGAIFGILRDIIGLQDTFATTGVVFCFDVGEPKRRQIYSGYKRHRHQDKTEEEIAARNELAVQLYRLRTSYLPRIGFQNVFWSEGFEADDIIASVVQGLDESADEAVVVSSDKDLFQLLRGGVIIHNPMTKKTSTMQSFMAEKGIEPRRWARIIAMCGCDTDEVPGIKGIGEKRAIQYLRGELKPDSAARRAIEAVEGREIVARNKALVLLPYVGTPAYKLQDDAITQEGWDEVVNELGLNSLRNSSPFTLRNQRAQYGRQRKGFGFA